MLPGLNFLTYLWNNLIWTTVTFLPAWWRNMQSIEDYAKQNMD